MISRFKFDQIAFCLGFTELRKVGFAFGVNKCKFWDFLGFEAGRSRSFGNFDLSDYKEIAICQMQRIAISELQRIAISAVQDADFWRFHIFKEIFVLGSIGVFLGVDFGVLEFFFLGF